LVSVFLIKIIDIENECLKEREQEIHHLKNEIRELEVKLQGSEDKIFEAENELQEVQRIKGRITMGIIFIDDQIESLKTKNSKLKISIKELAHNGDEAHTLISNELTTAKAKIRTLEDKLKDERFALKELEKEKNAIHKTNGQIISDYKQDLEILKEGMRNKAQDDEALFKRVLDEKGKYH